MSPADMQKRIRELERALEPFERVARINWTFREDHRFNADTPLRDIMPGIWPVWSDLERVHASMAHVKLS